MSKKAIVIGSGLVGSLWIIYLKKAGYTVIGKLVLIDLRFLHESNNVKSLIQYDE